MIRKKSITDDELIHLFEQHLISQCSCDLSLVKILGLVTMWGIMAIKMLRIQPLGVTKDSGILLKESEIKYQDENYEAVITYKTIDPDNFMAKIVPRCYERA